MRSMQIHNNDDSNELRVIDIEQPSIKSYQLLIRVKAAGINPIDTKILQAPERFPVTMPATLGCDAAGTVEAVGSEVNNFQVGDEVYACQPGFNGRQGTFADYAAIDQTVVSHKPESIDFNTAAAIPLVLITAWEALYHRAQIKQGNTVLIHGGAGGVGHVAIQLAKLAGAHVITTVSNSDKAAFVKALGADETILYTEQDFVEATLALTDRRGVDCVLDTVGGKLTEKSCNAIKLYGDLVSILSFPQGLNWGVARTKNLRLIQALMLSPIMLDDADAMARQGGILHQGAALIDAGKLKVALDRAFPLIQASDAFEYLTTKHPIGKIILTL